MRCVGFRFHFPISTGTDFFLCFSISSSLLFPAITTIKTSKGMALADMISGIYDLLLDIELPRQSRIYLLDHIASTE